MNCVAAADDRAGRERAGRAAAGAREDDGLAGTKQRHVHIVDGRDAGGRDLDDAAAEHHRIDGNRRRWRDDAAKIWIDGLRRVDDVADVIRG